MRSAAASGRATGWQSRGQGTRTCSRPRGQGRARRSQTGRRLGDLAPAIDDLRVDIFVAGIEAAEREKPHPVEKLRAIGIGTGRETAKRAGELARLICTEAARNGRGTPAERRARVVQPTSLGSIETQPSRIVEVL